MSDNEIRKYLKDHCYKLTAQEAIDNIINTSSQIVRMEYNSDLGTMTMFTPESVFTFKWIVKKF